MPQRDYAFGFHDDIAPLYSTGKGLTEAVVREISAIKKEPQWMLDYRLRSLELFNKLPMPDFGPDLSGIRFEDVIYYQKLSGQPARSWDDVPEEIKRPLIVWESQKQKSNSYLVLLPSTSLRWSTTI